MQLAGDFMTDWYQLNQQLQLDKWDRDGVRNVTADVRIKRLTPLHVRHEPTAPENDRIVVEIVAELRDYLVDKASAKVVQGDKTLGVATMCIGMGQGITTIIERM